MNPFLATHQSHDKEIASSMVGFLLMLNQP